MSHAKPTRIQFVTDNKPEVNGVFYTFRGNPSPEARIKDCTGSFCYKSPLNEMEDGKGKPTGKYIFIEGGDLKKEHSDIFHVSSGAETGNESVSIFYYLDLEIVAGHVTAMIIAIGRHGKGTPTCAQYEIEYYWQKTGQFAKNGKINI